ncbi:PAS domain-containing protein [Candidatus Binatia bacterium]|nr:PAS domain-containing protein [Candidatus Binatia bacterium]
MLAPTVRLSSSPWRSLLDRLGGRPAEAPLRPDYATPGAIGDARLERQRDEERRTLGERVRVGVLIYTATALLLAMVVDPVAHPEHLATLWALKGATFLIVAVLWRVSRAAPRATLVRAMAATVILIAACVSASSIIVGEDWSAALLCVTLAISSAGLWPWGVSTQLVVAPFLLVLGVVPVIVLNQAANAAFAGVISLVMVTSSIFIAREQERYRHATWQSLLFFRENMERLRQIAEHINGVLWLGERGPWGEAFLYVSPRYDDLWQLDRTTLQQKPDAWLDAVHPDDRARAAATLGAPAAQGEHECEYRLLRADGSVRFVRDYSFPIRDVDGTARRVARMSQDVTAERRAADVRRMRELALGVQAATEEERRRIARELHDELGQTLTGIKFRLAALAMETGADAPAAEQTGVVSRECMHDVDVAMETVHGMIHRLHPPVLDDLGLIAALRSHVDSFARRTGIACALELPDVEPELSREHLSTLFRVGQEALTNVARHAHASHAELRLKIDAHRACLTIADDGRGIADARQGFGTRGMAERAALLDGSLAVEPRPGGGTIVRLELPLRSVEAAA